MKNPVPKHIAIIMDGNGRWAKKRKLNRIFGHRHAIKAVDETVTACVELGVKYLTLYTFSTENWNRPKYEVEALMNLLVETVHKQRKKLVKNGVRLETIGKIEELPEKAYRSLCSLKEETKQGNKLTLVLALNYGARRDILSAVQTLAQKVQQGEVNPEDISEEVFKQHLDTRNIPDPDLLIRTSGEIRISNFLLWELAYTELYFTEVLWPDFRRQHLEEAIRNYINRERRFGKISEQLQGS